MVIKTRHVEEKYVACELCDAEIVENSHESLIMQSLFSTIKSMNPNCFESFNTIVKETPFCLCTSCYVKHRKRLGKALYDAFLNEIESIKKECASEK